MKISNRRAKHQFYAIYMTILVIFLINIIDDIIPGRYTNSIENGGLVLLLFTTVLLLFWRGFPFFKFDSDGEALVIKSSEPILYSKISDNDFFAEFPKSKLGGFKIKNGLLRKTLYLNLRSSGKRKTLKIPISYLNKDEVSSLKQSLSTVLRNNKKEVIDEQGPLRGRVAFG
ncbi:MAG: hypothetical protein KAH10_00610 [Flavobacteriales bacterium]|nr:hypothetical protein [Flavobacteriales bacterium]